MLKTYFILNLYFLMLFIEIRETQCAYVLEVRLRQYIIRRETMSSGLKKARHFHFYVDTVAAEFSFKK